MADFPSSPSSKTPPRSKSLRPQKLRKPSKSQRLRNRSRQTPPERMEPNGLPISQKNLNRRLWWTGAIFFAGIGIAATRMVYLQGFKTDDLRRQAEIYQSSPWRVPILRRSIVDRRSVARHEAEYLAVDRTTYTLWGHRHLYRNDEVTHSTGAHLAAIAAPIVEVPEADLRERFGRRADPSNPETVRVMDGLSEAQARRFERAVRGAQLQNGVDLSGYSLELARQRVYPQGPETASVVGYVGHLDQQTIPGALGLAGVEYSQEACIRVDPIALALVSRQGNCFDQQPLFDEQLLTEASIFLSGTAISASDIDLESIEPEPTGLEPVAEAEAGEKVETTDPLESIEVIEDPDTLTLNPVQLSPMAQSPAESSDGEEADSSTSPVESAPTLTSSIHSTDHSSEENPGNISLWRDGLGVVQAADSSSTLLFHVDEQVLQLTLDMRLQRAASSALEAGMTEWAALRGSVVVMDPNTGEILALVNAPTFDPNRYYESFLDNPRRFDNWAVSNLYEPGSTFKPITVALAMESGSITSSTHVEDLGILPVGTGFIQNYDYGFAPAPGWVDIGYILRRSSNVGMVEIINRMGRASFYDWLQEIGLGEASGVDLPLEPESYLRDRHSMIYYPVEAATTAFGQGVAVTPLQLVQLHAVIANGGYRITPHVVRGLVDRDTDELVWAPERPEPVRVLSEGTTRQVRQMMLDVVDAEDGTGGNVAIEGYQIGGKTGTAQKADSAGYLDESQRITSFVGYYPALEPRYVILAVVDNPRHDGENAFGGTVSAPIVRRVIEEIIAIEALNPTHQAQR